MCCPQLSHPMAVSLDQFLKHSLMPTTLTLGKMTDSHLRLDGSSISMELDSGHTFLAAAPKEVRLCSVQCVLAGGAVRTQPDNALLSHFHCEATLSPFCNS